MAEEELKLRFRMTHPQRAALEIIGGKLLQQLETAHASGTVEAAGIESPPLAPRLRTGDVIVSVVVNVRGVVRIPPLKRHRRDARLLHLFAQRKQIIPCDR